MYIFLTQIILAFNFRSSKRVLCREIGIFWVSSYKLYILSLTITDYVYWIENLLYFDLCTLSVNTVAGYSIFELFLQIPINRFVWTQEHYILKYKINVNTDPGQKQIHLSLEKLQAQNEVKYIVFIMCYIMRILCRPECVQHVGVISDYGRCTHVRAAFPFMLDIT